MRKSRLVAFVGMFVVIVSITINGCGTSAVKVNGTITKKGAPFTLSEKGVFQLTFDDEKDLKETYPATTKPDGSFTIVGRGGAGVPTGKYIVVLAAMDPYEKQNDLLKGKYTRGKSKLTVEIKDASPIKIDVE